MKFADSAILFAFSAAFFLSVYLYPEQVLGLVKDEDYKEFLTYELLTLGVFILSAYSSLVFWAIVILCFLARARVAYFVSALASGFYGVYSEIILPLMHVSAFGEWSPTGAFVAYWLTALLALSAAEIAAWIVYRKGSAT